MEDNSDPDQSDFLRNSINRDKEQSLPIIQRPSSRSPALQNVLFAFLVVAGQTGQNVVLPLWVDSGKTPGKTVKTHQWKTRNNTSNNTSDYEPFMDDLFVSLFSAFTLTIILGISLVVKTVWLSAGQRFDRRISHKLAVFTGFIFAVCSVLIVFSSSGKRTAPYLQSILINSSIPTTLVLRYCILKKSPTKKKLICSLATVLSLFVCLLPSIIPSIDPKHDNNNQEEGGYAGIFWPLCFMLGFIFTALTYITQEKLLQYQHVSSKYKVDVLYILFVIQLFQFVFILSLFWVDALPLFGNVDSIDKVVLNFSFGVKCFFGYAGCSLYPTLYGCLFVFCFLCYLIGGACLLRYSEGATYLAIVSAIVTPAGFLFWTLFKEQPTFHWHPEMSVTVWLNIVGVVTMVPAIYLYTSAAAGETSALNSRDLETTPLLRDSSFSSAGY